MSRGSGSSPQVYKSMNVAVAFELRIRNTKTVTSKQEMVETPMKKILDIQNEFFVKTKIGWRLIKKTLTIVTAVFLIGVYGDGFSSSA